MAFLFRSGNNIEQRNTPGKWKWGGGRGGKGLQRVKVTSREQRTFRGPDGGLSTLRFDLLRASGLFKVSGNEVSSAETRLRQRSNWRYEHPHARNEVSALTTTTSPRVPRSKVSFLNFLPAQTRAILSLSREDPARLSAPRSISLVGINEMSGRKVRQMFRRMKREA